MIGVCIAISRLDGRSSQKSQTHFLVSIHRRAFPRVWLSSWIQYVAAERLEAAPRSCKHRQGEEMRRSQRPRGESQELERTMDIFGRSLGSAGNSIVLQIDDDCFLQTTALGRYSVESLSADQGTRGKSEFRAEFVKNQIGTVRVACLALFPNPSACISIAAGEAELKTRSMTSSGLAST